MNTSLDTQALETILHYKMLSPGDAILAGLSGGADSIAMLHWLCAIQKEYNLDICAAHLNHGLRGRESDEDETFCQELCAAWGVPLHVKRIDLSGLTAGVEEAGRAARYAFFGSFEKKTALAHTLSDRMETFLMNAARGAALRGLCSIPPMRENIIRPLIECTRTQVETYCAAHDLSYRTDSSNFDTSYRRNLIRREIIPLLAPAPGPLRRMFRNLEADEAYLSFAAGTYEGEITEAPPPLKDRILRGMLEEQGREPSQARLRELEKQLRSPAAGRKIPQEAGEIAEKALHMEELSENFIKNLPKISKEDLANCLDCDTIIDTLVAGRRRAGDRMRLCNAAGTKSFKKLCQERDIPPGDRNALPVARDSQGLVWIEGFGCAHRCRITAATVRAIRITVRNGE